MCCDIPVGRRLFLYNTVCEIILHDYTGDAGAVLDACEMTARHVQDMLNAYDPESELGRMNRLHRPGVPYAVSAELYTLYGEWIDSPRGVRARMMRRCVRWSNCGISLHHSLPFRADGPSVQPWSAVAIPAYGMMTAHRRSRFPSRACPSMPEASGRGMLPDVLLNACTMRESGRPA